MSPSSSDLLPAILPIVSRVRQDVTWKKVGSVTRCNRNIPLGKRILTQHLRGDYKIGVCPIDENSSVTRLALLDLDSHHGETDWETMQFVINKVCVQFESKGCFPVAFRSSSGTGAHIFIIFETTQDAYSVRTFLAEQILQPLGFKSGTGGVAKGEVEIFPKQDFVPLKGCGNQFILPLAGLSVPLIPLLNYDAGTREDALKIDWKTSPAVPNLQKPEPKPVKKLTLYKGELAVIENALTKIDPDCDYDTWLKVGMALHATGDEDAMEVWDEWSSFSLTNYPGRVPLEAKWRSFRNDKEVSVSTGYIRKLAAEKGWVEDYSQDFEEIKDEATGEKKPKPNRFKPIRADAYLDRPRVDWLVKGVLPRKSAGMTYGGSGDGKTFAILDIACAVALNLEWNGHKARKGKVVYICAEGAGGFTTRLEAYIKRNKINRKKLGDYLTVIPAAPNFLKKEEVIELAEQINSHNPETDLIIIDTLAQTSTGGDENSAKDMNVMLRYVGMLRDMTGCASHLIHHAGKDEARGARGSSTLKADCDVQFHVSREGDKRLLWVAKMKDGIDGFGWEFALESEALGLDEDGDLIASCVVGFQES